MPLNPEENPKVFKLGICWSVIPASNRKIASEEHICTAPAMQYKVGRLNTSVTANMWLCLIHRAYMEKKGYILTKII